VNHKKIYRLYKEAKLVLKITPSKKLKKEKRLSMLMSSEFNECWSMDFVSDKLTDNRKIRCLNVIDNYSRYNITIEVVSSLRAAAVIVTLNRAIAKYGKPKTIIVDNGPEFRSKLLQSWAKDQQIRLHFIAPGKPTQNAYIESFNGKFRDECLNQHWFSTINEAKMIINNWRENYNVERPHSSLGYLPPRAFMRNNNNKLLY